MCPKSHSLLTQAPRLFIPILIAVPYASKMRSCFLLLSFAVLADAQGQCSQVYNASAAAAWVARAPQHVSRTGRALRRNEPIDGVCLHGAGQDPNSYARYVIKILEWPWYMTHVRTALFLHSAADAPGFVSGAKVFKQHCSDFLAATRSSSRPAPAKSHHRSCS